MFAVLHQGLFFETDTCSRIFYIEVMLLSSLLPVVYLGIHETRPSDAQKTESSIFATISQGVKDTCLRGVSMLFTEMIVGTFTLWSSFAFGTVLMMAASIPLVCTELYGWSAAKGGLLQTALLVGEVLGFAACAIQDTIIYPRLTAKRPNPEARLYIAVPATMIGMAGGIFLYAWMSRSSTHWAVLSIGIMFAGFGVTCIVTAVAIYVTDCYTAHAGSAISAVAFGENVFAAFLPLAVRDMYEKLGVHWAGSVLGFASLALCIAPVGLLIAGSRIRGRSKYLSGGFHRGA